MKIRNLFSIRLNIKRFKFSALLFALLLTFSFQLLTFNCFSQDSHFSQFYNSPLTLNPSQAGAIDGGIRLMTTYRNQWRSISTPYKTFGFSGDKGFFRKISSSGFLGAGLSFISDKAGDSELGLNQVNLSLAYHLHVSKLNMVSAGIQGGFAQRSINFEKLTWDNQYNGSAFDPTLPSNEPAHSNSISYFDFAGGLQWTYSRNEMYASANNFLIINMGIAVFHVSQPNVSFYTSDKDRLPMKMVIHGSTQIGVKNSRTAFFPAFVYMQQGPLKNIIVGTLMQLKVQDKSKYTGTLKGTVVSYGGYYRIKDALIPYVQIEKAYYALGLSYDINISGLTPVSRGFGGMEITLRYINPNSFAGKSGTKTPRFFN